MRRITKWVAVVRNERFPDDSEFLCWDDALCDWEVSNDECCFFSGRTDAEDAVAEAKRDQFPALDFTITKVSIPIQEKINV